MIDEKLIKRFIEGAKEAFKEVDNPTFTFPMTILSAYELATSIEELLKEQDAVVRCKDCKHRPKEPNYKTYESGFDIEFPEGSKCPCRCSGDGFYSWYPEDDWFCADGERQEGR